MTNRERALAVLRYEDYDRLPLVHFGYWMETLAKWASEGHVSEEEAREWSDGSAIDDAVSSRLGFDFNWGGGYWTSAGLHPAFERKIVEEFPDGTRHVMDEKGVVIMESSHAQGIPGHIRHTLVDRASWEEHYKWRLEFSDKRVTESTVAVDGESLKWDEGGLEFLKSDPSEDKPRKIFCGSLYGSIRDMLGMEGSCYLQIDDPELFDEIIDTVGDLACRLVRTVLEAGAKFDFGHFWEDICFRNGPIINPAVFAAKVGPHYKRITDLLHEHGIDIVSLDCDGKIDDLLPIWFENGVNTMFPIEVGVWDASIAPWREQYGKGLLGVGGMDKRVFAHDRAAVDTEVERLKPLVALGGYIPCPDHRIAPDGEWDLVRYYCDRMRETF